jgi:hypothetical protein
MSCPSQSLRLAHTRLCMWSWPVLQPRLQPSPLQLPSPLQPSPSHKPPCRVTQVPPEDPGRPRDLHQPRLRQRQAHAAVLLVRPPATNRTSPGPMPAPPTQLPACVNRASKGIPHAGPLQCLPVMTGVFCHMAPAQHVWSNHSSRTCPGSPSETHPACMHLVSHCKHSLGPMSVLLSLPEPRFPPSCTFTTTPPSPLSNKCLRNRHGEDGEAAAASGAWWCPCCRKSCGPGCVICCNCGPCRKKVRGRASLVDSWAGGPCAFMVGLQHCA